MDYLEAVAGGCLGASLRLVVEIRCRRCRLVRVVCRALRLRQACLVSRGLGFRVCLVLRRLIRRRLRVGWLRVLVWLGLFRR